MHRSIVDHAHIIEALEARDPIWPSAWCASTRSICTPTSSVPGSSRRPREAGEPGIRDEARETCRPPPPTRCSVAAPTPTSSRAATSPPRPSGTRAWTRSSRCAAATSSTSTTAAWTRASGSSTCGTSRSPHTPPTAMPGRPARLGCVVTTAGPGCTNAMTGIACARARRDPDPAHRRPGRPHAAQDGLAAGPAARRHDGAHHQVRRHRAVDRAGRGHGQHGGASATTAPGGRPTSRSRATSSTARSTSPRRSFRRRVITAPRRGRSAIPPTSRSWPTSWSMPSDPAFCSARRCGTAAATRRRLSWCASSTSRPTSTAPAVIAAARRPAPLQPHPRMAFDKADVIVIVGTPFDFRMGYGRRLGRDAAVVQIDQDYRTVGKNRDIALGWPVIRAPSWARSRRRPRAARTTAPKAGSAGWRSCRSAEQKATDKLMPLFLSENTPIHPYRARGNQRVPHRGYRLHRRRRRGDDQRPGGAAPPARHWMDRRARRARHRHRLRHGRQARQSGQGGLLLRRRPVRHDRVRHGNREPVRRPISR